MEQSEHAHLLIKFAISHGCNSWYPKEIIIVTLKIADHIAITDTTIMKKFEILQELTKCNTEIQREEMLLEKEGNAVVPTDSLGAVKPPNFNL